MTYEFIIFMLKSIYIDYVLLNSSFFKLNSGVKNLKIMTMDITIYFIF